jgi:two-component system nitrate/nitrite response regulator NarL
MWRRQSVGIVFIGKNVLFREGLSRILRTANFRIQGSVPSVSDLAPCVLEAHPLLFLLAPNGDDFDLVVKQLELIREQYPKGRIAVVADHYRANELVSAFRAGANGYLVDVTTCDAFIKLLELIMMGETIFPPAVLSFVRDPASSHLTEQAHPEPNTAGLLKGDDVTGPVTPVPQLSRREEAILRCLVKGETNKCIARNIDIAEATVKVHVKAILRKIRVQNRTQAAIWAMNKGVSAPLQPAMPADQSAPPGEVVTELQGHVGMLTRAVRRLRPKEPRHLNGRVD